MEKTEGLSNGKREAHYLIPWLLIPGGTVYTEATRSGSVKKSLQAQLERLMNMSRCLVTINCHFSISPSIKLSSCGAIGS